MPCTEAFHRHQVSIRIVQIINLLQIQVQQRLSLHLPRHGNPQRPLHRWRILQYRRIRIPEWLDTNRQMPFILLKIRKIYLEFFRLFVCFGLNSQFV